MKLKTKPNQRLSYGKWLITLCLALAVIIASCDNDDEPEMPQNSIVEIAQGNANLTSLVTALTKYPDLVTLLNGSGEFTVFAPTNDAFDGLLTAIGQNSIDDIPESVLRSVLEYHVVPGRTIRSTDLANGTVTTEQGEDITVNVDNGVSFNGSAGVVTANVEANNGVVHVIDQVLVQPSVTPIVGTIVAPAFFNKNFTTLIAAVQAASPSILTTLLDSDAKTLFAPTNDAFAAAGITSLPNRETLDAVLTYHVIGARVEAGDIADGSSSAATLNGDIFLSKGSAGVFINGSTEVTATNINASNGVVHVINRTLLPPGGTIADNAIDATTASTPEFTQLVAALQKVPSLLTAADADDSNLTVFAPTDAAFQALYDALEVADLDELEETIGNDKLAEVLQHHIVGARVFSSDISTGNVGTLNQEIAIDATNLTITDARGESANLIPANLNILGTNGVKHAIDAVLVPTGIL